MSPSNLWKVMTPIAGALGDRRWWPTYIVAVYRTDAIRIAEQAAGQLGFSFDGDIEVDQVGRCFAEAP